MFGRCAEIKVEIAEVAICVSVPRRLEYYEIANLIETAQKQALAAFSSAVAINRRKEKSPHS